MVMLTMLCFFILDWCVSLFILTLCMTLCLISLNGYFYFYFDTFFLVFNISNLLIGLSCLLCFLSLVATPDLKSDSKYMNCLILLFLILCLVFSSYSMLQFYVFFESSLVPTLVLIISWGYQPERLQAGTYMIMYTVGASLPLLMLIIYYCNMYNSANVYLLHMNMWGSSGALTFVVYGAFLAKMPMYSVHLWLPKAHVEAPLAGSMVLAGVLLKLGGFGLMEMNYCFNMGLDPYSSFIVSLSIWGGLLSILSCLRQSDVKSLVAYSSVGHMSVVIVGIVLDSSWGVMSAVLMMISHGFCSSCLFCLAYFSYMKSSTRNIPYMSGILQAYPILGMCWFTMCCVNMACPPTLNLISEMYIIPVMFSFSVMMMVSMGLMIFSSAGYNMYLYSSLNHGALSPYMKSGQSLKAYSFLVVLYHVFPLLLIGKLMVFNTM